MCIICIYLFVYDNIVLFYKNRFYFYSGEHVAVLIIQELFGLRVKL